MTTHRASSPTGSGTWLGRVGWLSHRHRRLVAVGWVLALLAALAGVAVLGRVTTESVRIPGSDSQAALDVVRGAFPKTANPAQPLVLHVTSGRLTDPPVRAAVEQAAARVGDVAHVTAVTTPYQPGHAGQLSADGTIGYLAVTFDVSGRQLTPALVHQVLDAARPATGAGVAVTPGGALADTLDRPNTHRSEALGLAVAAVVLLVTFGSWLAALVPLLTALVGLALSLSVIGLLGHLIDTPSVAATLATMIGLGVGIDYALFSLTRYRRLLADGSAVPNAVATMTATSGKSVVFAGGTVIISLAGLWLAGLPIVGIMGLDAGIAVLVAVAAALTLLPAVLGLAGERLRPKRPLRADSESGWGRLAAAVERRPWPVFVGSLLLLGALAAPALSLQLGQLDAGSSPTSQYSRQAYDLLARGFGPGANGPLLVTVSTGRPVASVAADPVTTVTRDLAGTAGVAAVSPAQLDPAGTVARWQVTPTTAPSDPATARLVATLRDQTLPHALAGTGAVAHVGGQTAGVVDLTDRIASRLPYVILAVVTAAAVLLLFAFRAPVVSAKAAAVNMVSIGAAYGALVMVFQWGWGARLLGLPGAVPVESYVPLILFAVLFGLSMDYEVFLVSAIQERYLATGDNAAAVRGGLGSTGRVISSAALIMVAIFASFVLYPDPIVKMFGVGLAVAVAVDATVVRGLLVPSTMLLLDRRNWWLPGWLDRWLPRLDVDPVGELGGLGSGQGVQPAQDHALT